MIIRAMGASPVTVQALAELTGTSGVTIRRDLAELEGLGMLRRVHGGAVAVAKRGQPMPYAARAAQDLGVKQQLAALTAFLVEDDQSVVLDNGSTLVEVARALDGRPLTVMCLSLHAAVALGDSTQAHLLVPGGQVSSGSLATATAAAIATLADFRADVAILGACAASPAQGLTSATWEDAQCKRAIVSCASRRILVASGTKLQRTASFRYAGIEELDDLITTPDAPPNLLDEFRAAGVRVHLTEG